MKTVFLSIAFLLPAACPAQTLCPWITKATAFGVLGTTEDSPMAAFDSTPTMCSFSYKNGAVTRTLKITVEAAKEPQQALDVYKHQCGSNAKPMRAIGNDAVMCPADKKGQGEEVFGRVRENVFTIHVGTSGNDAEMTKDLLMQKAGLVAEQISGNLF